MRFRSVVPSRVVDISGKTRFSMFTPVRFISPLPFLVCELSSLRYRLPLVLLFVLNPRLFSHLLPSSLVPPFPRRGFTLLKEPWVERVIGIEDRERKRRSLERRLTNARIGPFKPIADFDWAWPERIDRPLIEELFSLAFVRDATNIILVGPNGVGKTMLVKNLLHHAVLNGFTARFTMASDRLHELAAQDSDASLSRRLRRFTGPQLLAIDEVRYLNYDNRYADLLFEVVTRRYLTVPVLITNNKPFSEWADVFSSAACVVTLVDRLIHRSEIVQLDGESYRLREAKEQAAKRSKARSRRTAQSRSSRGTRS